MIREILSTIYARDLQKVIDEIKLYKSDEDLWRIEDGITNSAGNLALHLTGNINHFFGANLGNTGYKRERDNEFSDKNISRDELISKLENTISVLKQTLEKLPEDKLSEDYPEILGGNQHKVLPVIISMLSHLNYHLGQINYHRRLLEKYR